jgi:hypothetical protein
MRSRTAVQPPSWTERPPRKPAGEKANATRQSNLIPAQSMRNRCTEASGLCRSRRTVDAKVKCSSTAQLRFPDALRDPLTPHQSFPSSALTPCSTPPSTWTSAHDHPRKHLHQLFLTSLTPHPSPFLRPIALSSYHPNPTHDSTAPGARAPREADRAMTPRRPCPETASNLPATKPHIATASTVSLHCDLCAEQH